MTSTTELKMPGPTGLEGKTNRIIALAWLVLWAAIGTSILLGLGEWHGFFWGFIVAGIVAVFGTWHLYARPMTRKKCSAMLSWRDGAVTLTDPEGSKISEVRVDGTHRVLLIRSKAEASVLLRVEQVDERSKSGERIDLIGPLPVVLPVKVSGDALSFVGFRPGIARSSSDEKLPYQLCAEGASGQDIMTDLLGFLDCHSAGRRDLINLRAGDRNVKLDGQGFTLEREGSDRRLDFDGDLEVKGLARPFQAGKDGDTSPSAVEIFVALIPRGNPDDALVFQLLAIEDWLGELPGEWDVSEDCFQNPVLLYDDTPAAFVAKRALRRYVKKFAPSSPVLEILRG